VTQFKVGGGVYGDLTSVGFGGLAEYACAPESALTFNPANLTIEESAALPMVSIIALQGLRDVGKIKARQKVLIYSSSRLKRDERIGRVGQGQTYNRQTLSAA